MRKLKPLRKLRRTTTHRHALMSNLCTQLILHKRIQTTEAKAKDLRMYFEPLITKAKAGTLHAQREVFKVIKDKEAIKELFGDVASKTSARNGGYTRVVKMPPRFGDGAKMAFIELVDYSEITEAPKAQKQDRAKRVRGSKESKTKKDSSAKETAAGA
ncbi:MAG: 50S ribosomal protein L17 [Chloroherpetonaceae bacterium]|nr:50S ribosomal protein L17 [Chloroherpetonaceae bacterium]